MAALTAVLDLHKLVVHRDARNEPDDPGDGYYGTSRTCKHCRDDYPCNTVKAITEAMGR